MTPHPICHSSRLSGRNPERWAEVKIYDLRGNVGWRKISNFEMFHFVFSQMSDAINELRTSGPANTLLKFKTLSPNSAYFSKFLG